jgi:hypothetical protein
MKCSNCPKEAYYEHAITAEFKIPYCATHVPGFLKTPKFSGYLKVITRKPPVPAPVVEELVVEAPKPKPTKKPKVEIVEELTEPTDAKSGIVEEESVVAEIETTEITDADNS